MKEIFTLFRLNEFCAGPSETFEPYYGVRGDGDIYVPENIISFRDHVLLHTDGKGVHFMMADGVTTLYVCSGTFRLLQISHKFLKVKTIV